MSNLSGRLGQSSYTVSGHTSQVDHMPVCSNFLEWFGQSKTVGPVVQNYLIISQTTGLKIIGLIEGICRISPKFFLENYRLVNSGGNSRRKLT